MELREGLYILKSAPSLVMMHVLFEGPNYVGAHSAGTVRCSGLHPCFTHSAAAVWAGMDWPSTVACGCQS